MSLEARLGSVPEQSTLSTFKVNSISTVLATKASAYTESVQYTCYG